MNEGDQIRMLQKELEELREASIKHLQRINDLEDRIGRLTGVQTMPRIPKTRATFSIENFIGLRLIHFIGIVVLVIGLSIGVKYAIDRELVSETMRILLAYLAGLVLFVLSYRLRSKYMGFSAILLSGSMASLYFTTYGAYVYYGMFSFPLAFIIMILLTVFTVFESIRYNRQEIAILGLIGAYGIPFLISKNADRADLFFMYITIINIGVVYLCTKKAWKTVGALAQAITWILFIGWASMRFNDDLKFTGAVFMIFFFLLFHFSTLAYKFLQKNMLLVNDSYNLVLNNVALYLAVLFVFGFPERNSDNLSLISFIISIVTGLQALWFFRMWKGEVLTTKMLSLLSLGLFVLCIAMNWDGFTVTLFWLLTSVIVFAWGVYLHSASSRMTAMVLIALTLGKLLVFDSGKFTTVQKVIAYLVLGVLLLVVSFFYQKFRQRLFKDED
jgi:uncharacterized membrane protein